MALSPNQLHFLLHGTEQLSNIKSSEFSHFKKDIN